MLVAGSNTVSFIPNLLHKSITPFWVRKKQSILKLTALIDIQEFTFYFTKNIPYVTIIAKKIRITTPITRQTLIKFFASFISLYIEDSFSLFKFFSLTSCTSISLTNSSNVNPK